jgi:hypothetical protein
MKNKNKKLLYKRNKITLNIKNKNKQISQLNKNIIFHVFWLDHHSIQIEKHLFKISELKNIRINTYL